MTRESQAKAVFPQTVAENEKIISHRKKENGILKVSLFVGEFYLLQIVWR